MRWLSRAGPEELASTTLALLLSARSDFFDLHNFTPLRIHFQQFTVELRSAKRQVFALDAMAMRTCEPRMRRWPECSEENTTSFVEILLKGSVHE